MLVEVEKTIVVKLTESEALQLKIFIDKKLPNTAERFGPDKLASNLSDELNASGV
jgi:hypothetical protein